MARIRYGRGMPDPSTQSQARTVTFHLIKGPHFESHQVDGVIGSIAPNGRASLAFFVERGPIPQTITHEIGEDGTLGKVVATTGRLGIVREVQTGVVMDRHGLRMLQEQLAQMLQTMESEGSDRG